MGSRSPTTRSRSTSQIGSQSGVVAGRLDDTEYSSSASVVNDSFMTNDGGNYGLGTVGVGDADLSSIPRNRRQSQDGDDNASRGAANGDASNVKKTKRRIKVPLWLVLSLQSFVVAGAFVALIVYSSVQTHRSTAHLTTERMQTQLIRAERFILQPMQLGESMLLAIDQQIKREVTDPSYYCNDSIGHNNITDWYQTFERYAIIPHTSTDIFQVFTTFESAQYSEYGQLLNGSYGDGPMLGLCATQAESEFYVQNNTMMTYPSTYGRSEEEWLTASPLKKAAHIDPAQGVSSVNIMNMEDSVGWFSGVLPNPQTGEMYIMEMVAQPLKRNGTRFRNSLTNRISVKMDATSDRLKSMHDTEAGAASLYDLKDGVIIATSANFSVIAPNSSQDLRSSDDTPRDDVNNWYKEALRGCASDLNSTTNTCQASYKYRGKWQISYRTMALDSGLRLMLVIGDTSEYYYGAPDKVQRVLIGVGVTCAGISIIICIVVSVSIRVLVRAVRKNMLRAGQFRNSDVRKRPRITELIHLVRAFSIMNAQLQAAVPFIPQAVLVTLRGDVSDDEGDQSEDEGDVDLEEDETSGTGGSTRSKSSGGGTYSTSASITHTASVASGANRTSSSHHGHRLHAGALSSKRVGMIAINVRGISKLPSIEVALPSIVNGLVTTVQSSVEAERGMIDSYHGDHFVITFNAGRPASSVGRRVASSALAVANSLSRTAQLSRVAIGAAFGSCFVGMLGSASVQTHTVLGSTYTRAIALMEASGYIERQLEGLARLESIPYPNRCVAGPIVDGNVVRDMSSSAFAHLVGAYKPHADRDAYQRICEGQSGEKKVIETPAGSIEVGTSSSTAAEGEKVYGLMRLTEMQPGAARLDQKDEWLYEERNNEAKKEFAFLSSVMQALVAGNWGGAKDQLQAMGVNVGDDGDGGGAEGGTTNVNRMKSAPNGSDAKSIVTKLLIARLRHMMFMQLEGNVLASPWA